MLSLYGVVRACIQVLSISFFSRERKREHALENTVLKVKQEKLAAMMNALLNPEL